MWTCKPLWLAALLMRSALALPLGESIVYPYLLESRAANGDRMLRISDDLTLSLEHRSAYGDHLLVIASQEDGTQLHRYEPASDYNQDLFQDRKHMASVMVSNDVQGLHVNGIIGDEMRIKPVPLMERSSEGHVPHLLYREKPSSRRSRLTDYLSIPVAGSDMGDGPNDPAVVTELIPVIGPADETGTSTVPTNSTQHPDYLEIPTGDTSNNATPSTVSTTVHNDNVEVPTGNTSSSATPSTIPATMHEDYGTAPVQERQIMERADGKIVSEVHLVIDSTYLKAYNNNQAEVIKYFGVVMNAVNLRYETITHLNATIKIVGFTFNTRLDMEPYFVPLNGHAEFVDDAKTVRAFNNYMKIIYADLYAKVDEFFLVTGRTLACLIGGIVEPTVHGLAYIGGVCTRFKVGVVEDVPRSYDVVRTLSHEAAHTLGCGHDGDEPSKALLREGNYPSAKTCLWKYGFLMSYVRKNNKQYRFSWCCGRQMLFLSKLQSRACLLTEQSSGALPSAPKELPGSNTSLNAICKKAFARYGKDFSYDTRRPLRGCIIKCTSARSRVTVGGRPYVSRQTGETSSLEGSPCDPDDSSMVCIQGKCSSRNDYPYDKSVIPATTTRRAPRRVPLTRAHKKEVGSRRPSV